MRELVVELPTREDRVQEIYRAIDALARPLRDSGVEVIVGVGARRPIGRDVALLIHRAAREILGIVRGEPTVTLVTIGFVERAGDLVLTVDHDGRQPAPATAASSAHRRLQSLQDRFADRGGTLQVDRLEGRGTRYTARLADP
jgi:signal transduction histidine kinase